MNGPLELGRGWMRKAESDRLAAERIMQGPGPYDTACFHAQQAAEKYLKALLAVAGQPIPRSHDLEDLYDQCLTAAPNLTLDRMELSTLTPFAVETRYDPGFWPDQASTRQALQSVDRIRTALLNQLPPAAHP